MAQHSRAKDGMTWHDIATHGLGAGKFGKWTSLTDVNQCNRKFQDNCLQNC